MNLFTKNISLILCIMLCSSAFADATLNAKARACYEEYEQDYLSSFPVSEVAEEIHDSMSYDDWPIATFPVAAAAMIVIETAALPFRLAIAPYSIPKALKNSNGKDIYDGINARWSDTGHSDLYLKLLRKGRKIKPDLTEEEFNQIILTGYAEKFCAKRIKFSRRQMKKYIFRAIRSNLEV